MPQDVLTPGRDHPDPIALLGSEFDSPSEAPAEKILIICAAPHSGGAILCRLLIAAGAGVPHEYFHPPFARQLAARWGLRGNPLSSEKLTLYLDLLRHRRAPNNVFAAKLRSTQIERHLRNEHGAALFDRAIVVHVFQPDVWTQFASTFPAKDPARPANPHTTKDRAASARRSLEALTKEDAGFRRLFVLMELCPIFITRDELLARPRHHIERIANAVGATVRTEALESAIAASVASEAPRADEPIGAELAAALRQYAFRAQ